MNLNCGLKMTDRDMPRRSVVSDIADAHGLTKVEAEKVLETTLEAIANQIAERGRFHIAEFGSVSVKVRPPRPYFNPKTEVMSVSDGDVSLKIRISKAMKERLINKGLLNSTSSE